MYHIYSYTISLILDVNMLCDYVVLQYALLACVLYEICSHS